MKNYYFTSISKAPKSLSSLFRNAFLGVFALIVSLNLNAQTHAIMHMEFISSTDTTADFDVILTNDGTTTLNFNAIVLRANNAAITSIATPGAVVDVIALNNNTIPAWTYGGSTWPGLVGDLAYNQLGPAYKLNQSSSSTFFPTQASRPSLPAGVPVNIGRFRFVVTNGTWIPNSQLGFAWHPTAGIVCSVDNNATILTAMSDISTMTLTSSANQPLNVPLTPIGVMSGSDAICSGSSNISVAVTVTSGPYTLVYSNGTTNTTVSNYVSGTPISVSPTSTTTYSIVSIDGSTTGHSGSATISIGLSAPVVTSAPTNNTNVMSWPAISGAAWYHFEYRKVGETAWIQGGTTAGTTRTIYNLSPSTNYELRSRTFCSNSASGSYTMSTFSTTGSLACQTTPTATGSASSTSLTISWASITGPAYYSVQYKLSSSSTWLNGGTTAGTSRTVYNLAPGSYDVRVKSHCSDYSSGDWSNIVNLSVTTIPCQTAPTATAIAGSSTITASWAATAAAYYYVEYKSTSSATWINGGTTLNTSRTIYNLSPGSYDVRVKSYCSDYSSGSWSNTVTVSVTTIPCQTTPLLAASTGTSTITATWAATGATYYHVQYKLTSSSTWLNGGTTVSTSRTIYYLSPGTYDVRVRSHCSDYSSGAWSNIITVTVGSSAIISNENSSYAYTSKAMNQQLFAFESIAFPNPFNNNFTLEIKSDDIESLVSVVVYDATGRVVENRTVNLSQQAQIQLGENFQSGVYQVVITQNEQHKTTRIVKN
ncbi:MAG: T9SS type A sorting domain-containing protein [Bacteroidota bacterium]